VNTVFLCTGEGGHKTEITSLLSYLRGVSSRGAIDFIAICEGNCSLDGIKNYYFRPLRSKHGSLPLLLLPLIVIINTARLILLIFRHNPSCVISTGPGIVIIPGILFKILRKQVIFIETFSRFATKSITGRLMYRLADKFYVQNHELRKVYPRAVYAGHL